MEKIKKTTHRDTHSLKESISILDPHTTAELQRFVDMDISGWTLIDETGDKPKKSKIDTEPDWTPNL